MVGASRLPKNGFAMASLLRSEFVYHKRLTMHEFNATVVAPEPALSPSNGSTAKGRVAKRCCGGCA